MLAQNFKTASDLRITEIEFESLVRVLGLLEREEIEYQLPHAAGELKGFNMAWGNCGTVGCIAGWANFLSQGKAFPGCLGSALWFDSQEENLGELLKPHNLDIRLSKIQPAQAAIALRNFLTTGEANWAEAIST